MRIVFILILTLSPLFINCQNLPDRILHLQFQRQTLDKLVDSVDHQLEDLYLEKVIVDLKKLGLPSKNFVEHSAMILEYSEPHEQASWVAHAITPGIIKGVGFRTNDFRPDPKIKSGTAVEKDYFLKYPKGNGEFDYDGFGFDRGHLAPSADFRWSKKALSESYYYSNMSPQRPEFNREIWGSLENEIRGYIYRNPESTLFVVTGGILKDGLPVVERSINKVAIPESYFKVVIDPKRQQGIGFILPNKGTDQPLETFALTIDEVEKITGFDFFNALSAEEEKKMESQIDKSVWLPELQEGNVESLTLATVPRKKSYPATFGKKFKGQGITVNICGTVVGGRYSRKGNLLLNIDKKFPNHIFTVFIKKEHLINFSYDPLELIGKQICTKGKVDDIGGTPTIFLKDENKLEIIK